MPSSTQEQTEDLATRVRIAAGDMVTEYAANLKLARHLLATAGIDVIGLSDAGLSEVLATAVVPPESADELERKQAEFDPVDLLVPEWNHLQKDPLGPGHDEPSGLTVSRRERGPDLPSPISRVLAVESLRKVNALFGFTRIDAPDRVGELSTRLVPLTLQQRPAWTVATEDFGEGIFLQLDEAAVARWENRVLTTDLWAAHRDAHRLNFRNRNSETAEQVDPDSRLRPPRYWLVHTLAHVLIRAMSMSCGYSAASLSERLYAGPRPRARPRRLGCWSVPRRPTATARSAASCSRANRTNWNGPSSPHCAAPIAARPTRSAPPGYHRILRTSSTAPRATAASWRRRPRASGPTGSSTAGSSSTCPGSDVGFFTL